MGSEVKRPSPATRACPAATPTFAQRGKLKGQGKCNSEVSMIWFGCLSGKVSETVWNRKGSFRVKGITRQEMKND